MQQETTKMVNEIIDMFGVNIEENNEKYLLFDRFGLKIKKYDVKRICIDALDNRVYDSTDFDKCYYVHGTWEDIVKEIYLNKEKIKKKDIIRNLKIDKILFCLNVILNEYEKNEKIIPRSEMVVNSRNATTNLDENFTIKEEFYYRYELKISVNYECVFSIESKYQNKFDLSTENMMIIDYKPGFWEYLLLQKLKEIEEIKKEKNNSNIKKYIKEINELK